MSSVYETKYCEGISITLHCTVVDYFCTENWVLAPPWTPGLIVQILTIGKVAFHRPSESVSDQPGGMQRVSESIFADDLLFFQKSNHIPILLGSFVSLPNKLPHDPPGPIQTIVSLPLPLNLFFYCCQAFLTLQVPLRDSAFSFSPSHQ